MLANFLQARREFLSPSPPFLPAPPPRFGTFAKRRRRFAQNGFALLLEYSTGVINAAKKFSGGCVGFGLLESEDWKGCNSGENRITWQPRPDVRIASIILYYHSAVSEGYILAGRSLREIEKRESFLELQTVLALIATLFATFVVCLVVVE